MNEVIAGIDIGGTKIAVALETLNGERIAARRLPTEIEIGAYSIFENVARAMTEMLEENRAKLISIGIGCPSPLDIEKGLVMSPSNLRDWDNFPIVKLFRERFNVAVVLENDANMAALGEHVHGAGRGFQNIVYVTVSTGIGGGIAAATGEMLFAPLRKLLPQFVSMIPPEKINVIPAELGDESGVCGALMLAKKAVSNYAVKGGNAHKVSV